MYGGDSHPHGAVDVAVGGLELEEHLLVGFLGCCSRIDDVVVEGDGLVLVDTTYVPVVRAAMSDLVIRHIRALCLGDG